ncbi:MAG: putative 7-carboxy-7-deazaguanine synthase QueE [Clostridium sp.]|nr:putative 7-carboxy-7-deazaguanine synthase QueE [Clostridium sp.]MCM1547683.1 putative 7-carboxy-7-deazaguanine synthase QueE [Ruminococcus sp.]
MRIYHVVEKFVSINGEGRKAGQIAAFIRFRGCNLSCSYCDTAWANSVNSYAEEMTGEDILEYIKSTGVKNVTLTGGEPLIQDNIYELIELLCRNGFQVEIETNGSVDISDYKDMEKRPSFTLDYKLPSSAMEKLMLLENYAYLTKNDTVKFVCGSNADLEKSLEIITDHELVKKCAVYLSPVFGSIKPSEMAEFMIKHKMNGVNLQLQLHKFIWDPDKRGV